MHCEKTDSSAPPKDTSMYTPENDAFITPPLKDKPVEIPKPRQRWRDMSREPSQNAVLVQRCSARDT